MGVSENMGYLNLGVLIIRILLFRVPYQGPLFSETPKSRTPQALWTATAAQASRLCRPQSIFSAQTLGHTKGFRRRGPQNFQNCFGSYKDCRSWSWGSYLWLSYGSQLLETSEMSEAPDAKMPITGIGIAAVSSSPPPPPPPPPATPFHQP